MNYEVHGVVRAKALGTTFLWLTYLLQVLYPVKSRSMKRLVVCHAYLLPKDAIG